MVPLKRATLEQGHARQDDRYEHDLSESTLCDELEF